MPSTGGTAQWERSGGGELGAGHKPLIRLLYESVSAQMGTAYDQAWPPATPFAMESFAIAKALAYDVHGANKRLSNSFLPTKCSLATGMLQRWERIFGILPVPGDTEVVRRARIVAAWLKFATGNSLQPVTDKLKAALGPLYLGVLHQDTSNAVVYVLGLTGVTAAVAGSPVVTITGTPNGAYQIYIQITLTGGVGAAQFEWSINNGASFVQTGVTVQSTVTLGATGLTVNFPAGTYRSAPTYIFTMQASNLIPWLSTLAHVEVQLSQSVPGYQNPDGSPNAAFWTAAGLVNTILDAELPAWMTFDFYVSGSGGRSGFYFDEFDLDLELLDG